jgi:Xaa-Pro aminopeptidase
MSHAALTDEIDRRMGDAGRVMAEHGVDALVAVCAGKPNGRGWIRYFTGANIWGPRVFLVLGPNAHDALIITRSPDDAEWLKQTAVRARIESTLVKRVPPVERLIEVLTGLALRGGRIGYLNLTALSVEELAGLRRALPERAEVDLTEKLNRLRQIKSPFEITAMRHTGRLLARAMEIIADQVRPGADLLNLLSEAEGFLRAEGCELGRVRCAFNGRVYPQPVSPDRQLRQSDIFQVQLKYAGPLGYWHELAGVFAVGPLPPRVASCLSATEHALDEAGKRAVPGASYSQLGGAIERSFAARGFTVVGSYREHCHTIGTDESEGRFPPQEDWVFQRGMTLAMHPGSLLAGDLGFALDQTVVVESSGVVPLSPTRSNPWGAWAQV